MQNSEIFNLNTAFRILNSKFRIYYMKFDVNRVLLYVIVSLLGLIFFCTVTAFMAGKARIGNVYRHKDPYTAAQVKNGGKELQEFKELGTIRALTKPENPESSNGENLVITPWFAFETSDSAFIEELTHKKKSITTVFLKYFASHTQKELFSIGEKQVKAEILDLINAELVMGKIKAVYFDDYIFLD